jgi:proteasome lid subunit RPN8/RPN11
LIGGTPEGTAQSIYRLRNLAGNPLVTYEAAPEDLFAAQRAMRENGEQLLAIYHSHPRSADPIPSETDVRLAYYPSAVYLIVGLGNTEPCLNAFRISERDGKWQPAQLTIVD